MAKNPLAAMLSQAVAPPASVPAPGGKKVGSKIPRAAAASASPMLPGKAPPAAPKPSAKKAFPFGKKP